MKQSNDPMTLHAYLDGELSTSEARELEAALETDAQLATQLEDLRGLFTKMETIPEVEYQGDIRSQVLAQLHPKNSLPRVVRLALLGQAAFAAFVLALAWPFLQLFAGIYTPVLTYETIENSLQDTAFQFSLFWSDLIAALGDLIPQSSDLFAYVPDVALSNTLLLSLVAAATLVWFLGNGVVFTRLIQR